MNTEYNRSLCSGVIDPVRLRITSHVLAYISFISFVIFVPIETLIPGSLFSSLFGDPSSQMEW